MQNQPNPSPQPPQSSALSTALQQPLQQGQSSNPTLLAQLQRQPLPTTPPLAQTQIMNIPNNQKERQIIWSGLLEWHEKQKGISCP